MRIQISDCTLRDGGYLLDKNSDPAFIRGVMKGLADAGIDFVETGFLQTQLTGQTLVYADPADAAKYLPENTGATQFLGFCDNSRYRVENLVPCGRQSLKWLRICCARHELAPSLAFCRRARKMGYRVQLNPTDILGYSDGERRALIEEANALKPDALYIVDTFGAMYLEELTHIFGQVDSLLDPAITVGLHSHNNIGLSTALAETAIMLAEQSGRDLIVDGSLLGMGRGAGNACTELLASYINTHHGGTYNIPVLLDTIETYIVPLRDHIRWGYDLPMFVCGAQHAHVDNAYYLERHTDCDPVAMYEIVGSLSAAQRVRYGPGYSKTDFTGLQAAYDRYKRSR